MTALEEIDSRIERLIRELSEADEERTRLIARQPVLLGREAANTTLHNYTQGGRLLSALLGDMSGPGASLALRLQTLDMLKRQLAHAKRSLARFRSLHDDNLVATGYLPRPDTLTSRPLPSGVVPVPPIEQPFLKDLLRQRKEMVENVESLAAMVKKAEDAVEQHRAALDNAADLGMMGGHEHAYRAASKVLKRISQRLSTEALFLGKEAATRTYHAPRNSGGFTLQDYLQHRESEEARAREAEEARHRALNPPLPAGMRGIY